MFMLPQEMNIQHLEELESALIELIRENDAVVLDGTNVEKIDTPGIQMLCALQKSLQLTNKSIGWSGVSETLVSVATLLGTKEYLGL